MACRLDTVCHLKTNLGPLCIVPQWTLHGEAHVAMSQKLLLLKLTQDPKTGIYGWDGTPADAAYLCIDMFNKLYGRQPQLLLSGGFCCFVVFELKMFSRSRIADADCHRHNVAVSPSQVLRMSMTLHWTIQQPHAAMCKETHPEPAIVWCLYHTLALNTWCLPFRSGLSVHHRCQ